MMNQQWEWSIFLALSLFLGLTPSRYAQVEPQQPPVGQLLFRQYCASCHGLGGSGDGPLAGDLIVEPSDLTQITHRHQGAFPRTQMTRIISGAEDTRGHGTRIMPVWGERLQDDIIGNVDKDVVARGRIALLVDYLETLQPKQERRYDRLVVPFGELR